MILSRSLLLTEHGSTGHLDLTELIGVPLPPSVSYITGYEGFRPAYNFGPGANIGRLTKTFMPDPFFRDFAIIVTIRPSSNQGGVLFAITDAQQKVVQLGLALTAVEDETQRIQLYYTEGGQGSSHSQQVVSFKVPDMTKKWTIFTLSVQDQEVCLYMDCDDFQAETFHRSSRQLSFEPSSGIFVGNAGGTGLERFMVSWWLLLIILQYHVTVSLCVLGLGGLGSLLCALSLSVCLCLILCTNDLHCVDCESYSVCPVCVSMNITPLT